MKEKSDLEEAKGEKVDEAAEVADIIESIQQIKEGTKEEEQPDPVETPQVLATPPQIVGAMIGPKSSRATNRRNHRRKFVPAQDNDLDYSSTDTF